MVTIDALFVCVASDKMSLCSCSTTFTPSDKLLVIHKTFEELNQEVSPMLDGHFLWCMDDLLPLFIYLVVRARYVQILPPF